jgi:hypothetical protein
MINYKSGRFQIAKLASITGCLSLALGLAHGATLINFPFNEGTNVFVHDTAQGLLGTFGPIGANPALDTVAITNDSPSGLPGDRSFVNNRGGLLMTDDSATQSLNITNGPITIEGWVKVNSNFRQSNEGIAAYGNSYKIGLRSRLLTFTLYGIKDITCPVTNSFPVDEWVHVAAAWTPGVGANFYITSISLTTNAFTNYTTASAARPVQHNYLFVGSENFATPLVGSFDRVKIHNRVLLDTEIDNVAANPKANYAETKVAYDFNENAFPSTNTVASAPALPLDYGNLFTASLFAPVWTNDTPTGLTNDFALAFNLDIPTNRQRINLDFDISQLNLGANSTNYTLETWVKLPTADNLLSNRMVVLRTSGAAPRVTLSINTNRALWTTIVGNSDLKSTVIVPNDLAWHHIAVVVTNFAQAQFYLDGVLGQTVNRTIATAPTAAGITNLLIGMDTDALYFRGLLDRVRISSSALSSNELDSIAIPLPKLKIQPNGVGSFVLTWPTNFTDYMLESTGSIPSASWTNESYSAVGDQNSATIPVSIQNRFYRLRK